MFECDLKAAMRISNQEATSTRNIRIKLSSSLWPSSFLGAVELDLTLTLTLSLLLS